MTEFFRVGTLVNSSNLLAPTISWSILELGHKGCLWIRIEAFCANERERWVMFLDQDPYIPPRPKRHGFELVARGGGGLDARFELVELCFPLSDL